MNTVPGCSLSRSSACLTESALRRLRISAMRLRWRGSRCWTTTMAAGKSDGSAASTSLNALRPPADVAMATTSKFDRPGVGTLITSSPAVQEAARYHGFSTTGNELAGHQPGHRELCLIELRHERARVRRRERDQWGTHGRPARVAAVVGDGGLEGRDHRKLLEDAANHVQARLLGLGAGAPPGVEEARDRSRMAVPGGADAAGAAGPHVLEQEGLGASEDVEAALRERGEERLRVAPVAPAVLHAADLSRIRREQALDEARRDGHLRHRRDVVEVHAQARLPPTLRHLRQNPRQARL